MVITLEFLRKTNFHLYKKFKTLSWKNYVCLKLLLKLVGIMNEAAGISGKPSRVLTPMEGLGDGSWGHGKETYFSFCTLPY